MLGATTSTAFYTNINLLFKKSLFQTPFVTHSFTTTHAKFYLFNTNSTKHKDPIQLLTLITWYHLRKQSLTFHSNILAFPFIFHFLISHLSLSISLCNMSIIHEKSPKHCAEKQTTKILTKSKKKLLFYASTFFLSVLCLILLLWFILHPSNPQFSLTQIDINHLNITSPSPFLNSSINLTLLSTNPNKRTGIYYNGFLLHASYNSHAITPDTSVPPFFQDHQQPNLLSTSLLGNHQHVDPSLSAGKLPLGFTATGSLRWKVGNWISKRYKFSVDCVTVLPLGRSVSTRLTSKQLAVCYTTFLKT